jgi:hypothetical protein
MIDPLTEQIISLREATKSLPVRRRGKPVHISCVYRWTLNGCKGIKLESARAPFPRREVSRKTPLRGEDRRNALHGPGSSGPIL